MNRLDRFFAAALALVLALAATAGAKEFQWVEDGVGDGETFSDTGNWFDPDPAADPHNPSGPPGAADTANLASSATVNASGGSVMRLLGSGTSRLTLSGAFSVGTMDSGLTLAGSGTLTAQSVTAGAVIEGGNMVAENFLADALSVMAAGSLVIKSPVGPATEGDAFFINVEGGSTLEVQGSGLDVEGGVRGGSEASFTGDLINRTISKLTLVVAGTGSSLGVSGDCFIRDGSLDVTGGATMSAGGRLVLEGKEGFSTKSRWFGAGTQISGNRVHIGDIAGTNRVELSDGATLSTTDTLTVGLGAGGELEVAGSGTKVQASGVGVGIGVGKAKDGAHVDASGTVEIIEGALFQVAAPAFLAVGLSARGDLQIDGAGSRVEATGDNVELGTRPTGHGTIAVRNGGALLAGVDFFIGKRGRGEVTVQSGGSVQISNPSFVTQLGVESTASGTLLIDGATSQASLGALMAGVFGKAVINVSGGATVQTRGMIVANLKPSVASVIVGGGAAWTNDTFTNVGGNAPAGPPGLATMTVRDNATFATGSNLYVAAGSTLKVETGGKVLAGSGGFGPAGTVRIGQGGILSGKGKVLGQVIRGLGGIVRPGASPGTLTIEGDYTEEAGGTLEIELGGAGAKSDLLKVTGNAAVAGNLVVTIAKGFNPKPGQKFKILTAKKVTGTFFQVTGADVDYDETGITVDPIVPPAELTVTIDPAAPPGGTVTAGFLGTTDRSTGFTYTVVAKPAKGFVFNGWTGGITSADAALTFVMPPTLAVQANFIPDPFAAAFAGRYDGRAALTAGDGPAAGFFTVTIGKLGGFSAKFLLGGKTYAFKGVFNGQGDFARAVLVGGKLLDVALSSDPTGNDLVTGTVALDGRTYTVNTNRATFTKTAPTNLAGHYTILLPPNADPGPFTSPRPQGHGWATVDITGPGAVKLAGRLADGVPFTAAGILAKDGRFDFAAPLYKALGLFAGQLTFAPLPRDPNPMVSDVGGTLTWTKPVEPKNAIFPGDFATELDVLGSFYQPVVPNTRVFPGLDTAGNAELYFVGGDLEEEQLKAITISNKNAVAFPAPVSAKDKLKLTFTAKTGLIGGSFFHPQLGKVQPFAGVILQKQTRGAGYFLGVTDSGRVELAAP